MNIVYSSAGLIFGICAITNLIMLWNKSDLLKCINIIVIGLFIIYITFLIFYYYEIDLRVFFAEIGFIIDIIILACAYVSIDNISTKKSIIVNGIVFCLVMIVLLWIMITDDYDSINPEKLFFTLCAFSLVCFDVNTIIIRGEVISAIFLGIYLWSSIFQISVAFSINLNTSLLSILIIVYICFAMVLSFFGNLYLIIISIGISFCSMTTIWALSEKGDKQKALIIFSILAAVIDLYSCIGVNMDTATWIEVIYIIFFVILGIAFVIAEGYCLLVHCENSNRTTRSRYY